MSDTTYSTNYWTTREVRFADGSWVEENVPGPLSHGKKTFRRGHAATGDLRPQIISKAAFAQAIKAGTFSR